MLDYQKLKNVDLGVTTHTYSQRDTMLYALGIGMGMDTAEGPKLVVWLLETEKDARSCDCDGACPCPCPCVGACG